jgi:hypothetical protein
MLSAMVLEAPESRIDMVSNAQAFGRLIDGTENITDHLAEN